MSVSSDQRRPPSVFDLRIAFVADDPAALDGLGSAQTAPVCDGILAMLVADADGRPLPISRRLIDAAGWDPWEAWASARSLTETLEGPDEDRLIDVGGAELISLYSARPYLASLLPVLDRYVPEIGERGALVSAPSRHGLLIHPLHDETGRCALDALVPLTRSVHRNDGAPLSPQVYWWQQGILSCIPTVFGRDGIDAYPSPELAEWLDAA